MMMILIPPSWSLIWWESWGRLGLAFLLLLILLNCLRSFLAWRCNVRIWYTLLLFLPFFDSFTCPVDPLSVNECLSPYTEVFILLFCDRRWSVIKNRPFSQHHHDLPWRHGSYSPTRHSFRNMCANWTHEKIKCYLVLVVNINRCLFYWKAQSRKRWWFSIFFSPPPVISVGDYYLWRIFI